MEDEKLYWIAKKLSDVAKDIENLSEEEKQFVIEKAEKRSPYSLIELFNAINEYGVL